MSMKLNPQQPIYLQIMQELKKRTVRGQYTPGSQLPSVREMATEIGVNPNTIARVYMELEREGFIFTRRGQGSYITDDSDRIYQEREKLADEATRRFISEIADLSLNNGHHDRLIEIIRQSLPDSDTSQNT